MSVLCTIWACCPARHRRSAAGPNIRSSAGRLPFPVLWAGATRTEPAGMTRRSISPWAGSASTTGGANGAGANASRAGAAGRSAGPGTMCVKKRGRFSGKSGHPWASLPCGAVSPNLAATRRAASWPNSGMNAETGCGPKCMPFTGSVPEACGRWTIWNRRRLWTASIHTSLWSGISPAISCLRRCRSTGRTQAPWRMPWKNSLSNTARRWCSSRTTAAASPAWRRGRSCGAGGCCTSSPLHTFPSTTARSRPATDSSNRAST